MTISNYKKYQAQRKMQTLAAAFPQGIRCQKCLQYGHWSYECKNKRKILVPPSRSQILKKKLKEREGGGSGGCSNGQCKLPKKKKCQDNDCSDGKCDSSSSSSDSSDSTSSSESESDSESESESNSSGWSDD